MAIYSAVPPPPQQSAAGTASYTPHHQHQLSNASTASVDIEAWTVSALEALSVSPIARGTGNPLSIPLDTHGVHQQPPDISSTDGAAPRMKLRNVALDVSSGAGITPPRRPPSRRDSQRRREALLKGNEGSRQRRRWENDRLIHVPNVEPPLPTDWVPGPTHPVHHVPYQLAQFWDKGLRERAEDRKASFASRRGRSGKSTAAAVPEVGRVPRELRATAKRAPAVKGWLRVLEEPVRHFLVERGAAVDRTAEAEARVEADTVEDSDDEEIVFAGRKAAGSTPADARGWKRARKEGPDREAEPVMVLDSPVDDETAAFKRWLTHSISEYYGLDSRSVSIGVPARRVVYIGIRHIRQGIPARFDLPRPLWELF